MAEPHDRPKAAAPSDPADVPLPYADRPVATAPGHWVLARAGKRVLRPGGAARRPRSPSEHAVPGAERDPAADDHERRDRG